MSFNDVIKNSVLEGFASTDITPAALAVVLGITTLLGVYLYVVYRLASRNAFYSRDFNKALALMPVITAAIVLAMQSSIVISLGMVGALSIVRFRNAVKDPMDLVFLFWSISIGIVAGHAEQHRDQPGHGGCAVHRAFPQRGEGSHGSGVPVLEHQHRHRVRRPAVFHCHHRQPGGHRAGVPAGSGAGGQGPLSAGGQWQRPQCGTCAGAGAAPLRQELPGEEPQPDRTGCGSDCGAAHHG